MNTKLVCSLRVSREKFIHETYLPSDDIFALVISGSFTFSCDGVAYSVGPMEGALFRKSVLYSRKVTEPVSMYLFRYKSDSSLFSGNKIRFSDTSRIRSTIALLERLDSGAFKNDFEYRTRIFTDIVTQHEIETGNSLESPRDSIDEALSIMSSSTHAKVSLPEISDKIRLSYTQFSRKFKQKTGMTPSEYMANLRLGKAKKLLVDSELLVREIAVTCGFENEYYFSNFFKKMTGISPKEYRNLADEG